MLDLTRIEGFDWDGGNGRKNLNSHGVEQAEAEQVFVDPRLLVLDDVRHSQDEDRFHALGATADGRRLQISFTLRQTGTKIRVVSARDMNRKERTLYDQDKAQA